VSDYGYSKLIDEALDALPVVTVREVPNGRVTTCPVIDDEPVEFAIAILDQGGYTLAAQEAVRKLMAKHRPVPIGGAV
jgi:hypothetical protein